MQYKKISKLNMIMLYLIIILLFISCLHFTFNMDEEFTMGLMKYNYLGIIHIDQLDVHPPLYYLSLKLFLQIFTFWTSSMFIKVLFARIFSIISFILLVYGLNQIAKQLDVNGHSYLWDLFYLFIPSIIQYSSTIRMYDLASMFIVYELYFIIKFNKYHKNNYLILMILFALLAAYTHYYAAVSSGLFILLPCVLQFKRKQYKLAGKYFISGLCFALLYIPLIPFIFRQFRYESRNYLNLKGLLIAIYESIEDINSDTGVIRIIFSFLLLILFILIIFWSYGHINVMFNYYLTLILVDYLMTILVAFTVGIVKHTPFAPRYTYMIFSIYTFFIAIIFTKYIYAHKNKFVFYLIICLSLLCILNSVKSMAKNITNYDIPSIRLISEYNHWKDFPLKDINVTRKVYPTQFGKPIYVAQSAIYLQSINKYALVKTNNKDYMRSNLLGHNNHKLYRYILPNVRFKEY